jgi:hypothetical protein
MNTELRDIQIELKKPFPAPLHEIRDLPGTARKWVFLRWQTVRDRLDEVYPDWTIDYSEIQYLGNDAICRCGITILGVRKEAIASVPITLMSKAGNDMARGSAADRLAAEAIKNAAETWGVGRYLDDQVFTIRHLWANRHLLDDKMGGEIIRISEQYKMQLKANASPTGAPTPIKNKNSKLTAVPTPQPNAANSAFDREALYQETDQLMKHRGITLPAAKEMLKEWFEGAVSRQQLTDKELIEFRDRLSMKMSEA